MKDKQRIFFFGGVADEDNETMDDLESEFYNDLNIVDVSNTDKFRWFPGIVRGVEEFEPCPRMSALVVVKDSVAYLFGGLFEDEKAQITLNDFWSLDLKKMNGWRLINEADEVGGVWEDFEDEKEEEAEEEEEEDEEDDEEEENEEMEVDQPEKTKKSKKPKSKPKRSIKKQDKSSWRYGKASSSLLDNHPKSIQDEDFSFYYTRTENYWTKLMEEASAALDYVDEDGDEMTRDVIVAAGKDMAKAYYKRCQKNL